jgi:membrane associated rhomboid family serine protease
VPVIGASGAVSAVLGAYAIAWPWARIRCLIVLIVFITVYELPALFVLGFWFVTQLLEATHALKLGMDGGVAWWAHVGGFVAGAALMPLWRGDASRQSPRKESRDDPLWI